jgi:hypothetical protein
MKLIYLDTSHIALLTEEWKRDSHKVGKFVEKWRERDYVLALSQIHFAEISEHNSELVRKSRYKFLENLFPIHLESGNFFEKEILLALNRKGLIKTNFIIDFFSAKISDKQEFAVLTDTLNNNFFREMFGVMSKAQNFSWEAESLRKFEKNKKLRRLKDIPNDASFNTNFTELLDILNSYQNEITKELSPIFKESYQQSFLNINSLIESFANEAEENGYLSTISKMLEVDISTPKQLNKPVENAVKEFHFNLIVSQTALTHNIPKEFILKNISIEDCQSLWLCSKVKDYLIKANDTSPSNEYDLQHIQYLPYVDIFFADKRIVDKTKQVLKNPDLIESLKNLSAPINVSNNIESLERNLFQ